MKSANMICAPLAPGRPGHEPGGRREGHLTRAEWRSPRRTPLPPHELANLIGYLGWLWPQFTKATQAKLIAAESEKRRGGRAELKGLHPEPWTLSSAPTRAVARAAAAGPDFEAVPSPGREPGSPAPRQPQRFYQTPPSPANRPSPSTADTDKKTLTHAAPAPGVMNPGGPGISGADAHRVGGRGAGMKKDGCRYASKRPMNTGVS